MNLSASLKIKNGFFNFFLFYIIAYPIFCYVFGRGLSEGESSLALQLLQTFAFLDMFAIVIVYKRMRLEKSFLMFVCLVFVFEGVLHIILLQDDFFLMAELAGLIRLLMCCFFALLIDQSVFDHKMLEKMLIGACIGYFIFAFCVFFTRYNLDDNGIYGVEGSISGRGFSSKSSLLGILVCLFYALSQLRSIYVTKSEVLRIILFVVVFLMIIVFSRFIILSFNRSVQLAALLSALFVMFDLILKAKLKTFLLVSLFLLCVVVLICSNSDKYMVRWRAIEDDQGSGRSTLYSSALDLYLYKTTPFEKIFGFGDNISRVKLANEAGIHGRDFISAHSDFFDFLIADGVLGLIAYLCFLVWLVKMQRRTSKKSNERLMMQVLTIAFLSMSLTTGIMVPHQTIVLLTAMGYWSSVTDIPQKIQPLRRW